MNEELLFFPDLFCSAGTQGFGHARQAPRYHAASQPSNELQVYKWSLVTIFSQWLPEAARIQASLRKHCWINISKTHG